jgi:acyl-CoA reductase-like NAD-dependent aldehyde dehydrogenase
MRDRWNYPAELAAWKIGPALPAGNTLVLKPSEGTPLSALMLADLAAESFPAGVLNVVLGDGNDVGLIPPRRRGGWCSQPHPQWRTGWS